MWSRLSLVLVGFLDHWHDNELRLLFNSRHFRRILARTIHMLGPLATILLRSICLK